MARSAAKALAAAAEVLRKATLLEQAGEHAAASTLRREATRTDPVLFALVYLTKHLSDGHGLVSLSPIHLAWAKRARSWAKPLGEPMSDRRAEVAPRETGKSTWHFLILPLWAAAHGHRRFCAAFADTEAQAQTHLATFRRELDVNRLLKLDFADLCTPRTKGRGTVEADRVSLYHARSGFVFAAAGMDSSNLGMKVGDARPDLLVLDDIEPHEGRYSAELAKKRLNTLRQAILPLNIRATVILVGTVTMHGSIVHQVVQAARAARPLGPDDEALKWVDEERIVGHHALPIVELEGGRRASAWPEKWSLAFLESIEHTRQYALNYANDPIGADGDYWQLDDFVRRGDPSARRRILSIDAAVTKKKSSDFTGLAVLAYVPRVGDVDSHVIVLHAEARKLSGKALGQRAAQLVERYGVGLVVAETNQGGDLVTDTLADVPAKVRSIHQSEAKEVRAGAVLNHYQRGRVWHDPAADLSALEGQLVAFPRAPNDDLVDAVGSGVLFCLDRGKGKTRAGASVATYA